MLESSRTEKNDALTHVALPCLFKLRFLVPFLITFLRVGVSICNRHMILEYACGGERRLLPVASIRSDRKASGNKMGQVRINA